MSRNDDVQFVSSSIKVPTFSPPPHPSHPFSSFHFAKLPFNFNPQLFRPHNFKNRLLSDAAFKKAPLFCSASLSLTDSNANPDPAPALPQLEPDEDSNSATQSKTAEEERVLISQVIVRCKGGEELERKDLEAEALSALQASRANSALTAREVQEDVHRIIATGYFTSCLPVAIDTRDGIRLIFQVEPNETFQGLVCEGANVLPSKYFVDAFREAYGKIVNIRNLDEVISSINGWYRERGLFGMVSGAEILSGGIIKLQVSEAEVSKISLRFLDKTGEPTVGKTRPETILRQLTTKKGQSYSMIQGKRDAEAVLAMGIVDDVSVIPLPAEDPGKVDLTMNVVERKKCAGISGGAGISNGITSGPLAGLMGSIEMYHENLFGRNQKLNVSLKRGQANSIYRINYTDPWIEGDDKRTSRTIMVEKSRTPGTLVHGNQPNDNDLTIERIAAGIEFSRPFRPKWNGTAGLIFQRAGAHDERGNPVMRDLFGSPLTASGNTYDDMLLGKLETVYTSSGGPSLSMFAFNVDQGIPLPVSPASLVFSRVNARWRQGFAAGPASVLVCLSGGHMMGRFPPHEAFPIGGINSVRGYEEGAVGSGSSYAVASGEILFPLARSALNIGPVEAAIFADYGTDLGSGPTVPGDPAGAQNKPGSGYGYGIGIRLNSSVGPLRLEYAFNNQGTPRFHVGIGLRA